MSKYSDVGSTLPVRDFPTLEDMNYKIVDNINQTVPSDGILIHLGDWSFGGEDKVMTFYHRLTARHLYIIKGNHDQHVHKYIEEMNRTGCVNMFDYLELEIGKLQFCLFHYPIVSWNHIRRGSYQLHGHQHHVGDLRFGNGRQMDVGMDGNNLFPYKLIDVIDLLKDRKFIAGNGDHH